MRTSCCWVSTGLMCSCNLFVDPSKFAALSRGGSLLSDNCVLSFHANRGAIRSKDAISSAQLWTLRTKNVAMDCCGNCSMQSVKKTSAAWKLRPCALACTAAGGLSVEAAKAVKWCTAYAGTDILHAHRVQQASPATATIADVGSGDPSWW